MRAIIGTLPCHGHRKDHDAYRAELSGLFGIVTALSVICEMHDITSGIAYVGCDNDTALERCLAHELVIDCSAQHHDIIRSIGGIISNLPIQLRMVYVDGHED